jgi:Tol biopolymer transport system component
MTTSRNYLRLTSKFVVFFLAVAFITQASWATYPGKNGRIVFVARFSGEWQLYTINADGGDLLQVTHLPPTEFNSWFPNYSPDGRRIAFSHDMSGAPELYVINADGTGLTQLTNDGTEDIFPRWAPDGEHVTFSNQFIPGYHHLVTVRDDGSERRLVTDVPFDDYQVAYTIDGRDLIFASTRRNLVSALWSVNLNGHGSRQLTAPRLEAGGPNVSPDGRHLAMFSQQNTPLPSAIYVANLDGSQLRKLTNPNTIGAVGPVYSPDGTQILFDGAVPTDAPFQIYVMNADGTNQKLLMSCPDAGCLWPDWGRQE